MRARLAVFVLFLIAFVPTQMYAGQQTDTPASQPAGATTPPATQSTGTAPAPPVWKSTTVPAGSGAPDAKEKPGAKEKEGKSKKAVYSGPTEIIVLPPAPMLDEEGRQRLDPDGKPMFDPPTKQQRDKYGHPLFDDKGKPVFQTEKELGYDDHGKKIHVAKEKPPKLIPVKIVQGTFTVDGAVGKAALNYDIADLKYIYMYVPGIGVAVVSNLPFPGAKEEQNAFVDKALTVTVGEHKLELASDERLLGNKPASAFVRVDRDFALPSRFPVVGYGPLRVAPYAWPGAKPTKVLAGTLAAPPLPKDIRPVLALQPCPAGQMRLSGPNVVPNQAGQEQPCVAIPKGTSPMPAPKSAVTSTPAS